LLVGVIGLKLVTQDETEEKGGEA
ncbi:QacE family quaternary ammonium compound efflux SMR transporter, partial [Pseudomonas sp. GW456-E7]